MKKVHRDLINSLTERGYRLTPQRELLLSVLDGVAMRPIAKAHGVSGARFRDVQVGVGKW